MRYILFRFNHSSHESLSHWFHSNGGFDNLLNHSHPLVTSFECGSEFTQNSVATMNLNATSLDYGGYLVLMRCDLAHAKSSYVKQTLVMVNESLPEPVIK